LSFFSKKTTFARQLEKYHFLTKNKAIQIMGRGDKKTKRGKISRGSFGKSRPKAIKANVAPKVEKAAE
jgi:30S ribosomal protein S31